MLNSSESVLDIGPCVSIAYWDTSCDVVFHRRRVLPPPIPSPPLE